MRYRFVRGLIPALVLAAMPALSSAQVFVGVSVNIAPPPLPVYVQPPCPEPGYMWSPGYWAWDDGAYYWVPGTWVLPPEVGLLWTPGWWGWDDGDYFWHAGYWGPHVGFYGGVNYGYGYYGGGYDGGYWRGDQFYYNRAVVHVGPTIVNNYYHTTVYNNTYQHVSYNGGPGGVVARATHSQMAAEHEHHSAFTPVQQRQQRMAFADRSLRADYNHGRPPVAATARANVFHGSGAFAARAAGGPVHSAPPRGEASMRSDRPSWATGQQNHGQNREGRPMGRNEPMRSAPTRNEPMRNEPMRGQSSYERGQPNYERRQQPNYESGRPNYERGQQQNYERAQPNYERPQQQPRFESRPEPRSQPQFSPPQERGGGFAPRGPQQERAQPRGGGERSEPHRPPERQGGGRDRR